MNARGPGLETLRERLSAPSEATRRLAAHDLIELSRRDPAQAPGVARAMIDRLPAERDTKAALRMIRHLAATGAAEAMPALLALYDDPATPAEIAVEAVRAHDSITALAR